VVRYNQAAYVAFEERIGGLLKELGENPTTSQGQNVSEKLAKAIQEYNLAVERLLESQHTDLESMKTVLQEAIGALTAAGELHFAASEETVNRLKRIRGLESLQQVRGVLDTTIDYVSQQSDKRQASDKDVLGRLTTVISNVQNADAAGQRPMTADPVTGLPSSADAENYISGVIEKKGGAFLLCFQADRLEQINRRYGFVAGDQVLQVIAQRLAMGLSPEDLLFRWRGPAVLAVVERPCDVATLRSEVNRMGCSRFEHIMNISQRAVLLSLSVTCHILPIGPMSTLEKTLETLADYSRPPTTM